MPMPLQQIYDQFASVVHTPDEELSSVHLALKTLIEERAKIELLVSRVEGAPDQELVHQVAWLVANYMAERAP